MYIKFILSLTKTEKFVVITLKLEKLALVYHTVMHPKDADRMANSVDTDQIAPSGAMSLIWWVYTVCQDISVQKLIVNFLKIRTPKNLL